MSIIDIAAIATALLSGGYWLFLLTHPRRGHRPLVEPDRIVPPSWQSGTVSDNPLLNRPPNPSLDIVYNHLGKRGKGCECKRCKEEQLQRSGQPSEALLALMKQLEERAPSALAGVPYQPVPEELRLDLMSNDEATWAYSVAVSLSSVKQEPPEMAWEGEALAYE